MRHRNTCALVALLVACSPSSDADTDGAVTVRDSAGVEIVENHRPTLADEAWQLTSEPVLSLPDSVATGGSPVVIGAKRLSNGEILVVSRDAVYWLAASGELVRRIAQTGEGPGEFRYPGQLLVLAGDTIVVDGGGKTARWDVDGALLGEVRTDVERFRALGRWAECSMLLLRDGSRIGCQADGTIPQSATNRPSRDIGGGWTDPGPGLLRQLRRIYVASPALDTAHPLGLNIGIEQFGVSVGDRTRFVVHPMHARTQIVAGGEPPRIAIATNPAWEVEMWTSAGRLVRIIRLDGGRRAPTVEEIQVANAQLREQEAGQQPDPVLLDQLLSAVPTPDSLPGVWQMVMDDGGFLAVMRGGVWAAGFPVTIDFFDPEGRWLVSKEMPPRWRLLDFGEDYLLGVRYDEDDLPHLEMYGLKR